LSKETKCIWTLQVDNYRPDICELTFPAMQKWAKKIGAEFNVISERKWPDMPPVYEKLQLHTLGKDYTWNIYLDADAIVNHVEMFDPTDHLGKDQVLHWGADMAGNRWSYDDFFRRDGRHIGSGNWFTVASNWCLDLWHPLEDMTLVEAAQRIHPTINEQRNGIKPEHLIDDYTLSRNIARYGLKLFTFVDLLKSVNRSEEAVNTYFWHTHLLDPDQKCVAIDEILRRDWNVSPSPWDAALQLLKLQSIGSELSSNDYVRWLQPTRFIARDGDTIYVEVPTAEHKTVLSSGHMGKLLKHRLPKMTLEFRLAGKRLVAV